MKFSLIQAKLKNILERNTISSNLRRIETKYFQHYFLDFFLLKSFLFFIKFSSSDCNEALQMFPLINEKELDFHLQIRRNICIDYPVGKMTSYKRPFNVSL